jgi:hypothetical protein
VIFTLVPPPPCTVRGSLRVFDTLLVPINDLPGYYIRNIPVCKAPISAFSIKKGGPPKKEDPPAARFCTIILP